jgi:uncharacterized membrane protein YeaQ/YmgE (transglycosylase-associated protein family)
VEDEAEGATVNVLWWLIIGLLAGAIARLLVPGHDPLGFVGTVALGLVGSLIGGFLGDLLQPGRQAFSPAGLLGSIIGAVIALFIYRSVTRRRRRWSRRSRVT